MKYDFKLPQDVIRFDSRVSKLKEKRAYVDLTDKSKRSLNQNNYLHLILTAFAMEYGCTERFAKQDIFKKIVCPDIFVYEKRTRFNTVIEEIRSSADIPKEKMTECIGRFKEWSGRMGIPLPNATDQGWLREIEKEAERMKEYLK